MLVFKCIQDMVPKYLTELLTGNKTSSLVYALPIEINYSPYQGQQEKTFAQEPSVFIYQLYGTKYWTILGPQQITSPSKENLKHAYLN